ncbi:ectoine/hydroxyectoine ABC transporter substrate-binding protein EhuB (plasmid) [Mesorhizobium sp. L-2-11]|uniref:ectoine/hydroxyectoine ABC transporter substrate-binding protein EhuB n=1 Tax=Mesorhizobium sp. L-2-11 TaxID=2744521 RepID=UPI001928E0B0|nr:ectoine/hydroxyectoine ABC transporter substrate-binding protein EhuB [Mesorhizobium sp. L-2-11]BCH19828.1 ectoine/hydroxyectoine ABC transporter substrate-binding protein EhuB [Mesorhizobium sp. L-2-11]
MPALAQSTLEKIKTEGKVTIGIASGYRPWSFPGDNGTASGFSPDLVRAAFEPLGIKDIQFVDSEFPALVSSLVSNRFDVVAAGMWITPVRCTAVAFSDPDLTMKDAIIVKKGNPKNIHSYKDIAGNSELKIGADRGSAALEHASSAGVPKDQIISFENFDAAVAAVIGGRIDGVPAASTSVGPFIRDPKLSGEIERAMPFEGFVLANGREIAGYSAIAFRLDDKDLKDFYNKRLQEMKADGTVAAIMKKYDIEAEVAKDVTAQQICSDK